MDIRLWDSEGVSLPENMFENQYLFRCYLHHFDAIDLITSFALFMNSLTLLRLSAVPHVSLAWPKMRASHWSFMHRYCIYVDFKIFSVCSRHIEFQECVKYMMTYDLRQCFQCILQRSFICVVIIITDQEVHKKCLMKAGSHNIFQVQNSTAYIIYNATKWIFCATQFHNFLGGNTPDPLTDGGRGRLPPEPTPRRPPALRTSGRPAAATRPIGDLSSLHQQFLDPPRGGAVPSMLSR